MARRSSPVVNQTYETGCTWRMFRIFNFREGYFSRRLVSNGRHLNTHATGNGSSRSSLGVLGTVDEKYPQIGVSSRRRRDHGCKSISCVENAQEADQGNKVTKMTIDQKFVNKNYLGKEVAGCQPDQLLDALQILYSNKELFLKLLQDPNSLLVKQIHGLQSSQVNKYQNINATQFESCDRCDSSSSCEPQFSNKIVVLKPRPNNVKNSAETRFDSPWPHSPRSFSHNAQNTKSSHFPLGHIKRKLRYVMRVRRKEQQWRKTDGVPDKFPCGCQGSQDGKKVKELEIAGNSLTNAHANIEKRLKDSELCMGKEIASFGESCSRITDNASVSPSGQNALNIPVEGRKSQSDMLRCGIEEFKQCTNSVRRKEPLPDFESLPSLQRYCKHSYVNEGMRYFDNNQTDHRTKLGLQKEGENDSYSFLVQKNAPRAAIKTFSDKLQPFGSDISIRWSPPGGSPHAHCDIPTDGGYSHSPTHNFDKSNSTGGAESFQDSHPEIQILPFSPEVVSSSPSSCERIEDTINMNNNSFKHPRTEADVEHFTKEHVINPPVITFLPDESLVQVLHKKFEENHFADLIRSSLDPTNNLASSKDILDCSREILQIFGLKWDELMMKCESTDLHEPSSFDELKGSIGQLSCDTILLDCVIQTFMEVYQNCGFPFNIARKSPEVQAYVAKKVLVKEIAEVINLHFLPHPSQITLDQLVGKYLASSGSWLNVEVDTEDIVKEVEEYLLENLVMEIISEMDIRSTNHEILQ